MPLCVNCNVYIFLNLSPNSVKCLHVSSLWETDGYFTLKSSAPNNPAECPINDMFKPWPSWYLDPRQCEFCGMFVPLSLKCNTIPVLYNYSLVFYSSNVICVFNLDHILKTKISEVSLKLMLSSFKLLFMDMKRFGFLQVSQNWINLGSDQFENNTFFSGSFW